MRPRGGPGGPGRRRRVIIDSGAARPPRDARQQRERPDGARPKQPRDVVQPTGPVVVESGVTVRDFSQALGVPMGEIIKILMSLGQMRTATQSLTDEEVELVAAELKREVTIKHLADEEDTEPEAFEDPEETLQPRPPVVTIMGHVDHGKTTLLDAIRKTSVVATEAGGITQHIGAYQVEHDGRKITFLDTPGHEAFTAMRARGAKVTDIAVLVVAADDGVMPQTKESISHARAAGVPIVVAINKIDVPDADPNRVRAELAAEDLQPEEWGGSTQFSEVSAKQGTNLDDLLEKVLLVADLELEGLKANPNAEASGPIVESRLDVGRGPVATMLIHRGTLRVGDAIVAGDALGKVRALYNYRGEKLQEAKPGDPVEILGFDKPPPAGEFARVVESERRARELANVRAERLRREQLAQRPAGVSIERLFEQMQTGAVQDLNLIVKGDVVGSVEAVVSELAKIQHPEVRVNVIHSGVGAITENDVMLASTSNAVIVGFNVRPNAEARALAERENVEIRPYRVIYQLTEDIQQALVGMLRPVEQEATLGEAEVRALFRVSRLGTIAGCMVTSGVVRPGARRTRRNGRLRDHDRTAEAVQGRRPRGCRRVRVRHPARRLQRRERRRRARVLRDAAGRAHRPLGRDAGTGSDDLGRPPGRAGAMGGGYIGILSFELHFPEAGSLKGKRRFVSSTKAQLQNRFGASVAEVDHHELWQRARLTMSCVAREHREVVRLLDEAVRYLNGQDYELVRVERDVVALD
jgi:translation initiation factor IF-2